MAELSHQVVRVTSSSPLSKGRQLLLTPLSAENAHDWLGENLTEVSGVGGCSIHLVVSK